MNNQFLDLIKKIDQKIILLKNKISAEEIVILDKYYKEVVLPLFEMKITTEDSDEVVNTLLDLLSHINNIIDKNKLNEQEDIDIKKRSRQIQRKVEKIRSTFLQLANDVKNDLHTMPVNNSRVTQDIYKNMGDIELRLSNIKKLVQQLYQE